MLGSNLENIYIFLRTCYGGIAMGFSYDLLVKVLFKPFKSKIGSDIFFSISAFLISLCVLFGVSKLSIRFYMFCGFAFGWWIYFLFISKPFLSLCFKIEKSGKKKINKIYSPIKNKADNFILQNKNKISRCKLMISRIKNIPNKCKTSYNKYIKYIREKAKQ